MKKVYFLGPGGSYSDIVMRRAYVGEYESVGCGSFAEIARRTLSDKGAIGVLPIENSITSNVHENMDYLFKEDLRIVGEAYLKIRLNLLGLAGAQLEGIREVYSHPKALSQCKGYIVSRGLVEHETASTAAARDVVLELQDRRLAAIGSVELVEKSNQSFLIKGEAYSLAVLEEDIGDERLNITRFLFISSGAYRELSGVGNKTSVVFTVSHEPGALAKILTEFAEAGFNLTKIESRPIPATRWEYQFWVDLESGKREVDRRTLLEILERGVRNFKVMGWYTEGSLVEG